MVSRNPVVKTIFSNDIFMIYQPIHVCHCHCLKTIKVFFCTLSFKVMKNILNLLG